MDLKKRNRQASNGYRCWIEDSSQTVVWIWISEIEQVDNYFCKQRISSIENWSLRAMLKWEKEGVIQLLKKQGTETICKKS